MGSHHDHNDHHSSEKKPVSFTVPLIFGSVIVVIILLFVSLGDPKHGCCCKDETCSKECMEQCEKNGHHGGGDHKAAHMGEMKDHSHEESSDTMTVGTTEPEVADTVAKKAEHKEEAHH
jgi:hypothetical protein